MRTIKRLLPLPFVASCIGAIGGDAGPAPTLLAMSTDQVTIGAPLDFIGGNFLNFTKDGHTEIRFNGKFHAESGKDYAVDYRVRPLWTDGNHVVWPFVGPYSNPFTGKGGDQLGTFTGAVTAINVVGTDSNRAESESAPVQTSLK